MPIKIPAELPAFEILENENIFVMDQSRALSQDIRPLKIAIVNLMPTKIVTETQLLRLIGNSPLQVDITLVKAASHDAKNISHHHLDSFYTTFDDIKDDYYDGLIITGAPVETLPFEAVDYWPELERIMEWSKSHVFSTLHICWGAQAGLYYHYGVPKHPLKKKLFGVYEHRIRSDFIPLLRGFDDTFFAPHSRHTESDAAAILTHPELDVLADSPEAGIFAVGAKKGRQIFIMGHAEYDRDTLGKEYVRDVDKGLSIDVPKNYFKDDDPHGPILVHWRSAANLLFFNWLNYYVYQITPYVLDEKIETQTYADTPDGTPKYSDD